jgi:hypothetical protein
MESPGSDLAAVRIATAGLERRMIRLVLHTHIDHRLEVVGCLMESMQRWMLEVEKCYKPGGPKGPECQPGWIKVGDFCIPDPGGEG